MASKNIRDYIHPLHINGMSGRMLILPDVHGRDREILVVYGHHSTLERNWGLAQAFNDYGAVVMPDLPGFGGMDSFYKIGKKATLNNYADYMASIIKLRYKHRKVTLVGVSFGFLVVTRMLQRYPDLTKKVDLLISAVGFMRSDNFLFSARRMKAYVLGSHIISLPVANRIFRHVCLNRHVLRIAYSKTHNAKKKFSVAKNQKQFDKMMDMEIKLWHANDVKSHFRTTVEMLTVDNCNDIVNLPVWHVFTDKDNYFDNAVIEQQMRVVFDDYFPARVDSPLHSPSVIATKEECAIFIPEKLQSVLGKNNVTKSVRKSNSKNTKQNKNKN